MCIKTPLSHIFTGSYINSSAASSCVACSPGTISNIPGASQCTECSAGSYSSLGGSACITCQPGQFSATPTLPCADCTPGNFNNVTSATSCKQCSGGSFANVSGATYCPRCAGGYISSSGASSCSACSPGTFSNNNSRVCTPWTVCGDPTIYYETIPPTTSTDRSCAIYSLPPSFTFPVYTLTLSQSTPVGSTVEHLFATSPQSGQSLSFSVFRSTADFISIYPVTGELYISRPLPLTQKQVVVIVEVSDNRTMCIEFNKPQLVGGCKSQAIITISVAAFTACPLDQTLLLSDGSSSVIVEWTVPQLNDVGQNLFLQPNFAISNNSYPKSLFSLGESSVRQSYLMWENVNVVILCCVCNDIWLE